MLVRAECWHPFSGGSGDFSFAKLCVGWIFNLSHLFRKHFFV